MKKRKKLIVKLIRRAETIKTVAIVLLMVSCVYFGILIFQYQSISDSGNLSFFIWSNFEYMLNGALADIEPNANISSREIFAEAAAPMYAVVGKSANERIVLENNDREYKEICNTVSSYILSLYMGESRAESATVTVEEWTAGLNSEFIYLKLPIEIDNSLIIRTAYEGNIISKSIKSYDEIILTTGEENEKYQDSVVIYLGSAKTGERIRLVLNRSPLSVTEIINSKAYGAEKECIFAFELDNEEFSGYSLAGEVSNLKESASLYIDPMLIIPVPTVKTPMISLSVPESYNEELSYSENSYALNDVLRLFDIDINNARQYKDNDGNVAFVDDEVGIIFSVDGEISYTNSKAAAGEQSDSEKAMVNTVADLYDKASRVLETVMRYNRRMDILMTKIDCCSDPSNEEITVSDIAFDYTANGLPVYDYTADSGSGANAGHFITVRLYNGYIESFKIKVRNVEVFEEYLPNESAFTAMERHIAELSRDYGVKIYDMTLGYKYNPESSKIHTTWIPKWEKY